MSSFVESTFQEGLNKTKLKISGELCCANAKVKVTYPECVNKQHEEVNSRDLSRETRRINKPKCFDTVSC